MKHPFREQHQERIAPPTFPDRLPKTRRRQGQTAEFSDFARIAHSLEKKARTVRCAPYLFYINDLEPTLAKLHYVTANTDETR